MNCTEAREAMLVAEPAELRGEGNGALVAHLTECGDCAAVARGLSGDLDSLTRSVARRSTRWNRRVAALAIPIAAALVGVVTLRVRENRAPATAAVRAENVVSVQIAPGQQAAVFKTKDPKVTVVWLTPGGGL